MTATYTYDGDELARVRGTEASFTQSAELMQVGNGTLVYNDKAGTLEVIGQKDFAADESACSVPETFRGFVGPRTYRRAALSRASGRDIEFELFDLNAMAGFRRLRRKAGLTVEEAGKRPRETVAARGAWLMASPFVDGLFADNGRCDFPGTQWMDKADYRTQFPGDVIADMLLACNGYNAYIRDFGDGAELVHRNDNTSTADTSLIQVSNLIEDVTGDGDGLTFYPSSDITLRRSPDDVISELGFAHARGQVNEERTATADAFNGERGGNVSNSMVRTAANATLQARRILFQRSTEEDIIEFEILVPADKVNLIAHGDRMQARFTHLETEAYHEWTWFRVLECTKATLLKPAALYRVKLRLSPQDDAEPACPYPATPAGTYYALGGPAPCCQPHVSDGPIYYIRPGFYYPVAPMSGHAGQWHFPKYEGGGLGTVDWMGDCVQNTWRFIAVGNGTLTIQTHVYEGSSRKFNVKRFGWSGGGPTNFTLVGRFDSGDEIEVVVDDTSAPFDCVRIIDITDIGGQSPGESCGGKMGVSTGIWVPE